jgi:hypothetical protein
LQALTALNEPIFVECSRGLAARVLREEAGSDEGRLVHAFRLCCGRAPQKAELAVLVNMLNRQRKRFTAPGAKPQDLVAGVALPIGVSSSEGASWVAVARVLLNLDETMTRE